MEAINALIFAAFAFFAPNAHDAGEGYQVPPLYSLAAFYYAAQYPKTEPEHVIAVVVAEHGGKHPYPAGSVGDGGKSTGLLQVSHWERRRFNWCHDLDNAGDKGHARKCGEMRPRGYHVTPAELFGWTSNISVGAWNLNRIQFVHPGSPRCRAGSSVWYPSELVTTDEDGERYTEHVELEHKVEPFHHWIAHIPCGVETRDKLTPCGPDERCRRKIAGQRYKPACSTRFREGLISDLARWK